MRYSNALPLIEGIKPFQTFSQADQIDTDPCCGKRLLGSLCSRMELFGTAGTVRTLYLFAACVAVFKSQKAKGVNHA